MPLFSGMALIRVLVALPLAIILSWLTLKGLVSLHSNELFRIPAIIQPRTYGIAVLVVLAAGAASALVVRHKMDTLDLIEVLKSRK